MAGVPISMWASSSKKILSSKSPTDNTYSSYSLLTDLLLGNKKKIRSKPVIFQNIWCKGEDIFQKQLFRTQKVDRVDISLGGNTAREITSQEWQKFNFSQQYLPKITGYSHEDIGNDHKLEKLLIMKQILLFRTLGNIYRTVRRIWILMLGCKGLTPRSTGHVSSPHNIHKLECKQEIKMLKMAARNEILVMWKIMKMKQYL